MFVSRRVFPDGYFASVAAVVANYSFSSPVSPRASPALRRPPPGMWPIFPILPVPHLIGRITEIFL